MVVFLGNLCALSPQLLFGTFSGLGAVSYGLYKIYLKKKELGKKFVFETSNFINTIWISTLAGYGLTQGMDCTYYSLIVSFIGGLGIDRLANALGIGKTNMLGFIKYITDLLPKKELPKKKLSNKK